MRRAGLLFFLGDVLGYLHTVPTCSEEIIRNAESQGFFETMMDCVYQGGLVASIGSQACLSKFISDNATDNPYPIEGECRDTYQTLVDGITTNNWNCSPENVAADNSDTADCLAHIIGGAIEAFYGSTGFYPKIFCTSAQVRAFARQNAFTALLLHIWESDSSLFAGVVQPEGFCNFCVYELYMYLGTLPSAGVEAEFMRTECESLDGPTDACLATEMITNARLAFSDCAGWDILFEGPVCTQENVNTVETLIPAPYYAFAQCAYYAATPFCSTIPAYLAAIEADTSSTDCVACYTEFGNSLIALAAADSSDACGSDLFSSDCLVYQADALTAFATCAGTILNTDAATAVPPVTTIAPATTDAESATTVVATTAAADTTTKDATVGALFAVVVWVIVLTIM